jgi:hypothetical protein
LAFLAFVPGNVAASSGLLRGQASGTGPADVEFQKVKFEVIAAQSFKDKVEENCKSSDRHNTCVADATEVLFCDLLSRSKPALASQHCEGSKGNASQPTVAQANGVKEATEFVGDDLEVAPVHHNRSTPQKTRLAQIGMRTTRVGRAPEDDLAKEMTHDLEMNFNKIAPFGKEDTARELQDHAAKTQDTLVDAVENAEVAEIKRAVFRALTRLRAATIKEFDTIARLETQAIDAYNDAHHYRAENPLAHLHEDEAPVETDKLKSFH